MPQCFSPFYSWMRFRCMDTAFCLSIHQTFPPPHLLASMNNAAINIHIQALCGHMFSFLLHAYEWNSWVTWQLCLALYARPLSKVAIPFHVPRTNVWGFSLCTSSLTLVIWFLDDNAPSGCDVISSCGFDLHFLMTKDVKCLFMSLLALIYLPWKNFYSDFFYPFLNWFVS